MLSPPHVGHSPMSAALGGLPETTELSSVDVPGATLPYWDPGGPGEPGVLMHGKTGSWRSWEHQIKDLQRNKFRVIAYSRRGHDGSRHSSVGSGVDDLLALIDQLGISTCHLVGHAAGGVYALDFALTYPTRLRSLTLACSTLGLREPEFQAAVTLLQPDGLAKLPASFCELGPAYRITNQAGVERWRQIEHSSLSDEFIMQDLRSAMTWNAVEALDVRSLVIAADADLYMPPPLADIAAHHFRNVVRIDIPDSGHNPQWERPTEFNRALIHFLIGGHGAMGRGVPGPSENS